MSIVNHFRLRSLNWMATLLESLSGNQANNRDGHITGTGPAEVLLNGDVFTDAK